jgi:hypothetical protein
MKDRVLQSFENPEHDRCVDIFERQDGTFGYEEFRRDPEDQGRWQTMGKSSQRVFAAEASMLIAANDSVKWLEVAETWQAYLVTALRGPAPSN